MGKTRRSFLRKASALSALAVGATGAATAAVDCSGVSEWDADATYNGGDQVTYEGSLWTAEWWTQSEPAESESAWTLDGACDGSGGDDGGNGDDGGDSDDGDTANCDDYPEYDSAAAYTGGDRVIYDGRLWEAEWWTSGTEPAESEAVWTLVGACGNFSPTASISATPRSPAAGDSVSFDAGGSSDSDGSIESYSWEFGDGTTASGQTATHSYSADGEYTVTLTVTDDAGATGTDTVTVSVGDTGDSGGTEDDVFAPYQGTWGSIVDGTQNVDTDRVVVSFVGDATDDDAVNPGWLTSGGQRPLTDYADEIQTLQDNGVEVWVAIGGWDGRTVARDATDATELKDVYADILDTLGVTHLDIDDENADETGRDGSVYDIRNEALAMLQDERPEVKVSYTVPAGQGGIENRNYSPAKDMVSDAVEKGIDLTYVNIMTMGFSGDYTSIIPSAGQGTVDWLANVYPDKTEQERWEMLGVTPNVGEDNFSTDDASAIVDWAEDEDLGMLSFWALYKDSAAEQASVFYDFASDEG